MNKLRIALLIFFLIIGLTTAFLTFNLSDKDSYGKIRSFGFDREPSASAGSGVDSSNDGVAIGLGIISGFSFLSSALLLSNLNKQ